MRRYAIRYQIIPLFVYPTQNPRYIMYRAWIRDRETDAEYWGYVLEGRFYLSWIPIAYYRDGDLEPGKELGGHAEAYSNVEMLGFRLSPWPDYKKVYQFYIQFEEIMNQGDPEGIFRIPSAQEYIHPDIKSGWEWRQH